MASDRILASRLSTYLLFSCTFSQAEGHGAHMHVEAHAEAVKYEVLKERELAERGTRLEGAYLDPNHVRAAPHRTDRQ